ncbi:NlpC/P60 family protein [Streptomyces sp. NPDC057654]|uniref:C40 family peptidase n=1 Tax=Streptomyces sp. NPDC057654 TaxID=3346196 RepID=UPI00367C8A4E
MASHRRPTQSGLTQATVVSVAVATAAAALAATPAGAEPREHTARAKTVKAQVDRLYEQAERATERFNAAGERSGRLRGQVARIQDRAARGQERVNRMRTALGAIAGAQYRSGGIDPSVALLLSSDPDGYLEKAATLDRLSGRQAGQLRRLQGAQRALGQERVEASRFLADLEDSRRAVQEHKQDVERKLATARRLLNSLSDAQRQEYDRASRSAARPTTLPDITGGAAASGRAAAAVAAVRGALGSPYVWGASGPGSFDCSGLMQWAYGRAGVSLPRTSQAQRNAGQHVPVSQARPGDLVVYRDDASHVGMYVGNGQVVHAPYPGASVRTDPVGMMPISSVTRP